MVWSMHARLHRLPFMPTSACIFGVPASAAVFLQPSALEPVPIMAVVCSKAPLSRVSAELRELEKNEPLLRKDSERWVMFPVEYPEIFEMYKKHEASRFGL